MKMKGLMLLVGVVLTYLISSFSEDPTRSVFDMPFIQADVQKITLNVFRFAQLGKWEEAEELIREGIKKYPEIGDMHYNLACLLAVRGRKEEALRALSQAITCGFWDLQHIQNDKDLDSLKDTEEFYLLLEKVKELREKQALRPIQEAEIIDRKGKISQQNTRWDGNYGIFLSAFKNPPNDLQKELVIQGEDEIAQLLNRWYKEKKCAGNYGDFYHNNDDSHSRLKWERFRQLSLIQYTKEVEERGFHRGLQTRFLFNRPVIGNSSTAVTQGWIWRSLPRLAMTSNRDMSVLALQYRMNQLYIYPEHHDYDERQGDLFPTNTPYLLISQGSSGSDQPFLQAIIYTLAAFLPSTKERLIQTGMLIPTLQYIFRWSIKGVESDDDYLSGKAHPVVFSQDQIDLTRMVQLANRIEKENLPPLSVIRLVNFRLANLGSEIACDRNREVLCYTPHTIGLIYQRLSRSWTFEVDATQSADLEGKPLTYRWCVLQGNPDQVKIEPLQGGGVARITVNWYSPFEIYHGKMRKKTRRIDIGCFVFDGQYWSPPSIISVIVSAKEKRQYRPDGKIMWVDYCAYEKEYDDPVCFPTRNWRDEFLYTGGGELKGWIRINKDGQEQQEYTSHGLLVKDKDNQGRVLSAWEMEYQLTTDNQGNRIQIVKTNRERRYRYTGPGDEIGELVPIEKK